MLPKPHTVVMATNQKTGLQLFGRVLRISDDADETEPSGYVEIDSVYHNMSAQLGLNDWTFLEEVDSDGQS